MASQIAHRAGGPPKPPPSPAPKRDLDTDLDSAPDSDHPEPAKLEAIGRYELCFELASGGMATVYLARAKGSSGFEKLVALKRIHRHLAKERDYVEMFLDEARIASRITHSNVCSVFDFGESEGEYYIAMEYLVGEPLSRLYRHITSHPEHRESKLMPLRMCRIIADACEGLHAAHELRDSNGDLLNVVHRDVSARNLFVTYDGVVQVVDFGIASARQRVHHTSTGQVKGTFPYMAPEQLTAGVMDRRVDIWALGVVLWELLTLKRLFRRDTDVNTMYAVLSDEIRPPSEYRRDISPDLDAIVLKALQRNPEERYQTAREMGQALIRFLAKQQDIVGPVELSEWMKEVFPDGEKRKRNLMEIARSAERSLPPVTRVHDPGTRISATMAASLPPRKRYPHALRPAGIGVALAATAMMIFIALNPQTGKTIVSDGLKPPPPVEKPLPPQPPGNSNSGTGLYDRGTIDDPPGDPPPPVLQPPIEPEVIPPTVAPPIAKRPKQPTWDENTPRGKISLSTKGTWAEIYWNNKKMGATPITIELPEGKHKLRLVNDDEDIKKTITVSVVGGKTVTHAVDMLRN